LIAARQAIECALILRQGRPIKLSLTSFEQRRDKVISRHVFAWRMVRAIALWFVLIGCGLALGMAGYAYFEGMSATDAFLNASMILSGMGPAAELKTTAGKLFAGSYAILSGLIIIIATGFVLAPIFHRVLHRFHVETSKDQ
jgi:hypothetical protein